MADAMFWDMLSDATARALDHRQRAPLNMVEVEAKGGRSHDNPARQKHPQEEATS